jgi:DNA-directed RNA polymerase specialized sigma24 family protein
MKTRQEIDEMKGEGPLQWALEMMSDPRASVADRAAAGVLVYDEVRRVCRLASRDPEAQDEVAQNTMLRLIRLEAHARAHTVAAVSLIRHYVRYARNDWFRERKLLRARACDAPPELSGAFADGQVAAAPAEEVDLQAEVSDGLLLVLEDTNAVRTKTGRANSRQCTDEWLRVLTDPDLDWADIWAEAEVVAKAATAHERGVARNNAQARYGGFRERLIKAIDTREAAGSLSQAAAHVLRETVARHRERQRDP